MTSSTCRYFGVDMDSPDGFNCIENQIDNQSVTTTLIGSPIVQATVTLPRMYQLDTLIISSSVLIFLISFCCFVLVWKR